MRRLVERVYERDPQATTMAATRQTAEHQLPWASMLHGLPGRAQPGPIETAGLLAALEPDLRALTDLVGSLARAAGRAELTDRPWHEKAVTVVDVLLGQAPALGQPQTFDQTLSGFLTTLTVLKVQDPTTFAERSLADYVLEAP
jgi:hypothetical protein